MRWLWALACCAATAPALAAAADFDRRAGAWDRSVRLEGEGRVAAARALLLEAWGAESPSYEVTVRIAWLSLLLEDAPLAVASYRRARALPGHGPEATEGLASALTLAGYQRLAEGERAGAREAFREALSLDSEAKEAGRGLALASDRLAFELWGAFVGLTGATPARGGAGFIAARASLFDHLRFGAAFRHLELSVELEELTTTTVSGGSPGRGPGFGQQQEVSVLSEVRRPFRQEELYGWLGFSTHWVALDAMGLALFIDRPEGADVVPGQAARLRVGHRFGLLAEQALLFRAEGESLQLTPMAFAWPHPQVGLAAGARVTVDHVGTDVSGRLGLSLVTKPAQVHLEGFLGTERWPLSFVGNSVLSTAAETAGGGAAASWFRLTSAWSLGLHGSLSRLVGDDAGGAHLTAGAGVRWSPSLE